MSEDYGSVEPWMDAKKAAQNARSDGYSAGRSEAQATIARLESELAIQRQLVADAMAALAKERAAADPIDLWPTTLTLVSGGTFHKWPTQDQHLFTEWRANTGTMHPKPTQYRTCIHPKCKEVQNRPAPKG
jgi:hypothetical protein